MKNIETIGGRSRLQDGQETGEDLSKVYKNAVKLLHGLKVRRRRGFPNVRRSKGAKKKA